MHKKTLNYKKNLIFIYRYGIINVMIKIVKRGAKTMKQGIHPEYNQTNIKCACGEVIETGSTKQDISVEVCSKCHPFFTGKQKLVDTGGRVDRFKKRFNLDK